MEAVRDGVGGSWRLMRYNYHRGPQSTLLNTSMKNLKMFETTVREPGPGGEEKTVRVMAESAQQARELLQQLHGVRSVPYLPKMVPH